MQRKTKVSIEHQRGGAGHYFSDSDYDADDSDSDGISTFSDDVGIAVQGEPEADQIRADFPETFLFDVYTLEWVEGLAVLISSTTDRQHWQDRSTEGSFGVSLALKINRFSCAYLNDRVPFNS